MVVVPDQQLFTLLNVSQCPEVEIVLLLRGSKALLLSASGALNVVHPVLVDGILCVNVVMQVTIFVYLKYRIKQYDILVTQLTISQQWDKKGTKFPYIKQDTFQKTSLPPVYEC